MVYLSKASRLADFLSLAGLKIVTVFLLLTFLHCESNILYLVCEDIIFFTYVFLHHGG